MLDDGIKLVSELFKLYPKIENIEIDRNENITLIFGANDQKSFAADKTTKLFEYLENRYPE